MTTLTLASTGRGTPTPIQEYDESRRAQARAAGRPVERTLAPGFFGELRDGGLVDVAMVWTDESGNLVYFCADESRTPTRLTIEALDLALTLPARATDERAAAYAGLVTPRRLIVSDHTTLRRVMAWVNVTSSTAPEGDYLASSVGRRLSVASRLVASTRLVVLTRALTRKFWLGAQYDPEDFLAWRRAFGFGSGATIQSVMAGLVDLASEGRVFAKWAREAFSSESFALMSASYPGLRAAVSTFRRIEAADTATRAILATDPLLRERALLDGSVSSLRILNVTERSFTATVSTPFKLRPGKTVLLIDPTDTAPGGWAETGLEAVTVNRIGDQDQLVVRITGASSRSKTNLRAMIADAQTNGSRSLLITESPYMPFGRADSKADRWTQPSALRIEVDTAKFAATGRRDIPLDIIVAGAPTV